MPKYTKVNVNLVQLNKDTFKDILKFYPILYPYFYG